MWLGVIVSHFTAGNISVNLLSTQFNYFVIILKNMLMAKQFGLYYCQNE